MQGLKRIAAFILILCMIIGSINTAFAAESIQTPASSIDVIRETAKYLQRTIVKPEVGSVGGEWAVIGLARSECEVPLDWYNAYYENLTAYVKEKHGILSEKKYTDYSRVIIALTAIGKDPRNVGGYNLLEKLSDYNRVTWQGINGSVFALIALDSGNYSITECSDVEIQTTRELLISTIMSQQLKCGGFSLSGKTADSDVTALALQALAPYKDRKDVGIVISKAVDCLSNLQSNDGGYSSYGVVTSESAAQVIVALTALGIDPDNDSRFVKNKMSVLDNLYSFYVPGGGFRHTMDDACPNGMSTEQGFYAMVAYSRFCEGKNALYNMVDVADKQHGDGSGSTNGLKDKHPDIKILPVIYSGKTFYDIKGIPEQDAIEALASRGILSGVGENTFEPERTVTRAEFAAIVVRALGLSPAVKNKFTDVSDSSWYAPYIGTANSYGITTGTSTDRFFPNTSISREQAAVMLARAAKLCGMHNVMDETEVRDVLAQFPDYTTCSGWAGASLAFCFKNDILSQELAEIKPQQAVTRAEIARMIFVMLKKSQLI